MNQKLVTVIGGSGFLGRYVVRELAQAGYRIRVVSRHVPDASFLKPYGDLGQIAIVYGNLTEPETVTRHIAGSYAVINLVGILAPKGRHQRFNIIHANGAEKIAQAVRSAHVSRLIHVSALGVDKTTHSRYARTKMLGEKAVHAACPEAVILRPSILFGPEDGFFNKFARMALFSPALPLIGGGKTKFQPAYVADVAKAVRVALEQPGTSGKTYELGGPEVYSFKELLQYMLKAIGRKRVLVHLPFPLAKIIAFFMEFLPTPPLTRDQVKLLKVDNTVADGALTFKDLGIRPSPMELIVPDYLRRFRRHNLRSQ